MQVTPYLMFDGRTEEAIEFYKKAVGATVEMMMRFKDNPDKSMCAPGAENKVMHSCLKIGDTAVMASDGRNTGKPDFKGISLSLNAKDEAHADKMFAALGEGRPGADGDDQNILRQAFRHGRRQVRRQLDDHRRVESRKPGPESRSPQLAEPQPTEITAMSLKLYYHPLSSFCHKALIALYEGGIPFEPVVVDLSNEESSAVLRALWPVAKFPVLRDEARGQTVAEATVIIEYLDAHYGTHLIPADADQAWQTRMWDRFYDLHLHTQMQKIVGDKLRPADAKDPFGVEQARKLMRTCYAMIERDMADKKWAMGDTFSLADCAAAPALFYSYYATPFDPAHSNLHAYRERLLARPSYARALKEAEPYFQYVPLDTKPSLKKETYIMPDQAASPDFVISRVFDAPRDLVWHCFTQPERMKNGGGRRASRSSSPKWIFASAASTTTACKIRTVISCGAGMVYREIAPPDRIVFINSFSDEAGGLTRHPLAPQWPLQMLSTFTFEEAARRQNQIHRALVAL